MPWRGDVVRWFAGDVEGRQSQGHRRRFGGTARMGSPAPAGCVSRIPVLRGMLCWGGVVKVTLAGARGGGGDLVLPKASGEERRRGRGRGTNLLLICFYNFAF